MVSEPLKTALDFQYFYSLPNCGKRIRITFDVLFSSYGPHAILYKKSAPYIPHFKFIILQ